MNYSKLITTISDDINKKFHMELNQTLSNSLDNYLHNVLRLTMLDELGEEFNTIENIINDEL